MLSTKSIEMPIDNPFLPQLERFVFFIQEYEAVKSSPFKRVSVFSLRCVAILAKRWEM